MLKLCLLTLGGISLAMAGCAGFTSTPISKSFSPSGDIPVEDGIVYYMPKRPIVVQVTLDDHGTKSVSLQNIAPIPDRSHPYLLHVPVNYMSENHVTISVGPNGLLQSASTAEVSGAKNFTTGLGTTLGTLFGSAPFSMGMVSTNAKCQKSHSYSDVIWPERPSEFNSELCGIKVHVSQLFASSFLRSTLRTDYYPQSGIFYKSEIPYRVDVTDSSESGAASRVFVAYSPDLSPVQFVPLQRSFFADNTTAFTLNDGILAKAESDTHGEATAAVELPADFIGAYMSAMGKILDSLKANNTSQNELAVSLAQRQLCLSAIAANPIQGKSLEGVTQALAVIKAACGS